jgi:hypothetical protein
MQTFLLGLFGSPTWTRTRDLRINSPSLYQLSYQGIVQFNALRFGSPTWTRTRDLRINSPSLYQLSYQGIALRLGVN